MLRQIQSEMMQQKSDMREMEENIKKAINNNIDEKFKMMEAKTLQLEQQLEQQQISIDRLEKEVRRKNLIIFGVEETEHNYRDLHQLVLDIINNDMGVVCQKEEIDNTQRIGKRNDKCRPILISLTTTWKKIEILKKKKTLDNLPVYIKEDFPKRVLQKRKELQEQLKNERDQGKKVVLRYDKIINIEEHRHQKQYTNNNNNKQKGQNTNKRVLSTSPEVQNNRNKGNEAVQTPTYKKSKGGNNYNITSYMQQQHTRARTSNSQSKETSKN